MLGLSANNNVISKIPDSHIYGEDPEKDLAIFLKECKAYLKKYNEDKIRKAFHMCLDAHTDKLRKSGDPQYTHSLAIARIVISEIPLDDTSVVAALLHDITEDSEQYGLKDIQSEFGSAVAEIVDGVSKIQHIESRHIDQLNQIENYRKLLLSLFKDVRIILIKLADTLHNMRTLDHLIPSSQTRIAQETMEVYVPFANRFGLRNLKWELEDLSFKYLNREAYDEIKEGLNSTREEREEYVRAFIAPIVEKLTKDEFVKKNKIKFDISGRPKHIYSIFNKMRLRGKKMDELYDLFAIRLILDTADPYMCFYIYGLIASIFPPVPETFKDYINSSKKNGYQSIHSAVVGPSNKIVEVQIRTREMHEVAEKGLAAHFKYKSGKVTNESVLEDQHIQEWMSVVRDIFEGAGADNARQLLEEVKKNLLLDEIYVYTRQNEFRSLPKDSTPLDFAYAIHTEIGSHLIGAKVNGRIVPIDYKLQSGDIVEIITSRNQEPKPEWMNIAITSKAKSLISKFLKDKEKQKENEGRAIWAKMSAELGLDLNERETDLLAQAFKFDTASAFFYAIGTKEVDLDKARRFIRFKINDGIRSRGESVRKENGRDDGKEKSFSAELRVVADERPMLLNEISAKVLAMEHAIIDGVTFDTFDAVFEAIVTVNVPTEEFLSTLVDEIKSVKGVHVVEVLEK